MAEKLTKLIAIICAVCVFSSGPAVGQDFKATQLFDKVFKVENPAAGEEQIVITSDKGLVVLNSFSSGPTAERFRAAIAETLKRDDFLYLINMLDRLDRCGGSGAYEDIARIGHRGFRDKYGDNDSVAVAEVNDMIAMWRWKEDVARERLAGYEPGSEQAIGEQQWINTCKSRAEELESGFSFVPPTETYDDRMTLDLGDLTLNLIWFGRAKGSAISVIVIPELKLAILPDDLLSPLHLAPYPHPRFKQLDVTRWIQVLGEILEGESPVDNVLLCDFLNVVWSRDRTQPHLDYIRRLWSSVRKADADGMSLNDTYTELSLDNDFAFVKEMPVYVDRGDEWVRPQHRMHIRLFFLQGKTLASDMIMNAPPDSLSAVLAHIEQLQNDGVDIFVEEEAINAIGYNLLSMEQYAGAIEVFEFNVGHFPESFNVYDSFAEALMKSGDKENAILNYRKSLELNPDNGNAREMLKTLESN